MKTIITCLIALTASMTTMAQQLKPTDDMALVHFFITDYDKIPEVNARVDIETEEGSLMYITDETGKFDVLLKEGQTYPVRIRKFGKSFMFTDDVKIPSVNGPLAYNQTLKIRLIKNYVRIYRLEGVNFDLDKHDIREDALIPLNNLLKELKTNENLKIELAGHTDDQGDDDYNMVLSQRRALAVVNWLQDNGISADRLIAKGYGETAPVTTNDSDEGRQQNRRTEVRVIEE